MRLYDDYDTASEVVTRLKYVGIPESDLSMVANNQSGWYRDTNTRKIDRDADGVDDRIEGAEAGAGIGAAAGTAAGLLAGFGAIAIPGIGPVVAAGWLAAAAAGAAAGGAAGGLVGALTQIGVSDDHASTYAEGIRRGGVLVTARVSDEKAAVVEGIMDQEAIDIAVRQASYRESGWRGFDEKAPPYRTSAERPRFER